MSNQKIKYMMNLELMKMESKNPKMFKKSMSILLRITDSFENEKQGNGKTFKLMMENFDCFRWMLFNSNDDEFKDKLLSLMYATYKRDGNKFQNGFNEFFTYISKHSFTKIGNGEIPLFRVMSSEEYENLNQEGNQNPCWATSTDKIEGFGILKVLTKETKRSVLVFAIYESDDIIYYNDDKSFNNENECWVKKNAKPKYSTKLFGFEKTYIKRRTGLKLDEVDFDGTDSFNGFGWIPNLKSKYGIVLDECKETLTSYYNVVQNRLEIYVMKNNIEDKLVIRL